MKILLADIAIRLPRFFGFLTITYRGKQDRRKYKQSTFKIEKSLLAVRAKTVVALSPVKLGSLDTRSLRTLPLKKRNSETLVGGKC